MVAAMPSAAWTTLAVIVPADACDLVSDVLMDLSGRGVTAVETPSGSRVTAFFPPGEPCPEEEARGRLAVLAEEGLLPGAPELSRGVAPEEDWMAVFRSQHHPVRVSPHLTVRPSWCEPEPGGPGTEVVIDPGLAFGTGSHATTHLVLTLLDRLLPDPPPASTLDLGTGTGVLAIAAARLGAPRVLAVDTDPAATAVAGENAEANGVAGRVTVLTGSLADAPGPHGLILANLSTRVHLRMAGELAAALAPGGLLLASGITAAERGEAEAAFRAAGLRTRESAEREGWAALAMEKR